MEGNIDQAGLRPEFCSHSARVMSFKTKKSLPKASRWPHPQSFPLSPEVLASAGYFHDPADNEPDRTTCWMCGESMKGWAEDDDPWTLHIQWSSNCSFARLALLEHERDTQNPSWSDSPTHSWGPANEWFPRGSVLIESRLATFCGPDGPWKHEGKKGIPTRLELARAGFHFTPNLFKKGRKFDVDDTTSCCYCHRSVTEWEVDDDPVSVHLKKGACIFFTASQPPETTKKSSAKPSRKHSKILNTIPEPAKLSSNSTNEVSVPNVPSDSEATNQPSNHRKKPSSVASTAPKTGRRQLKSSTSGKTEAVDEPTPPESENSVQQKPRRPSRKVAPVSYVQRSPEPLEQSTSKPPVTLAKSTRLSRSTSKATSASTSKRLSNSSTTQRPRTRANSNASSHLDDPFRLTSNQPAEDSAQRQTDDEQPVSKPKNAPRQKHNPKSNQASSVGAGGTKDHQPNDSQMSASQHQMQDAREPSVVEAEIVTTKKTRVPGKTRTVESQVTRFEITHSPPARQAVGLKSPPLIGAEASTRIKGLSPRLFPGFNPQAPQLYPTLLPIAGKSSSTPGHLKHKTSDEPQEAPVGAAVQEKPTGASESEKLMQEYLEQQAPVAVAEGWLPNPYNPSRPFPPLTAEEARMPLGEYFAYRARQEEDAFLEWVEEKQMKPWLQAVQNAQDTLQSLVRTRQSSRTASSGRPKSLLAAASAAKENHIATLPNPAASSHHPRLNGHH